MEKKKNPHLELNTPALFLNFRKAFLKALSDKEPEFEINGNVFTVEYAREVIQVVEPQFKDLFDAEEVSKRDEETVFDEDLTQKKDLEDIN